MSLVQIKMHLGIIKRGPAPLPFPAAVPKHNPFVSGQAFKEVNPVCVSHKGSHLFCVGSVTDDWMSGDLAWCYCCEQRMPRALAFLVSWLELLTCGSLRLRESCRCLGRLFISVDPLGQETMHLIVYLGLGFWFRWTIWISSCTLRGCF